MRARHIYSTAVKTPFVIVVPSASINENVPEIAVFDDEFMVMVPDWASVPELIVESIDAKTNRLESFTIV